MELEFENEFELHRSNVLLGFDVAIIEIVDQFKLYGTSKARAVLLPSASDINFNSNTSFTVSGWGSLSYKGQTPKKLHVVIVPWVPDDWVSMAGSQTAVSQMVRVPNGLDPKCRVTIGPALNYFLKGWLPKVSWGQTLVPFGALFRPKH